MTDSPFESKQRERIPVEIFADADAASRRLAEEIAAMVQENDAKHRATVLGLATGSTPVALYRHLIKLHQETGLSFRNVIAFNLDEYYGLSQSHSESYWRFMHEHLFAHVDIPQAHIHIPDGRVPRAEVYSWCERYEEEIQKAGGIDLQVLGIGRTGHIGFNEPGSTRSSRTRLVTLDRITRRDAARDFLSESDVPRYAITMGVATILRARRIVLLAWGEAKAGVIAAAVEGEQSATLPASLLQAHPDARVYVDFSAASELTRIKSPWLVSPVTWTPELAFRAVTRLAPLVKKSVLKLLDEDYAERGMAELLTEQGPSYRLNIRVFNNLQHTITGWPGGKPDLDDSHRPERAFPFPKRIVVLSPEPSDDVIGMGGTLRRLAEQEHEISVIYQTSGNLAVSDDDARIVADLISELTEDQDRPTVESAGQGNAHRRKLKACIRRAETRASLDASGVGAARGKFLDLPFYEKGRNRHFCVGKEDTVALADQLQGLQPHQIFVTGHSHAPGTVGAICFEVFRNAFLSLGSEAWQTDCRVWLYRGPGRSFEISEVQMAVPLSPSELTAKVQAIHRHQSQRGQNVTESSSERFWQEAEKTDRETARQYRQLGLADYEAMETFRRWLPTRAH